MRKRISKGRAKALILHADNGNAMGAAKLERRLEELGVLRSFSRERVLNDNPYSGSLFRTAKYRPDYPRRPLASKDDACQWVVSFVDWYKHLQHHSGIKFVTPQQRHNGDALEICHHRAVAYEQARQRNQHRWSRATRCWHQPEVVWINPPPAEPDPHPAKGAMAACTAAGASSPWQRGVKLSHWKRQLLDGASEMFTRGKKSKDKVKGQAKEAKMLHQITKLQIELEWLKKVSAALTPVNCASWSITTIPGTASANNVRC